MGYIDYDGYTVYKKDIETKTLNKVKKELTVKPLMGDFGVDDGSNTFELFKETEDTITVPRYYGVSKFGPVKNKYIKMKGESVEIKFEKSLRDYQVEIVNKCYDYCIEHGGGLLSVPCGYGKTIMALKLASMLGLKTLVVVHKTFLQNQWIERANQFTDAKIGIIRQDKVDTVDKQIVIGMIQSISKRDYDQEIFNDFGLVIYDEAHHCASKVYSQALFKTGCKYTLSLTATPERPDGLTKVMYWFLGETIHRIKSRPNKHVLSYVFNFNTNNSLFVEKKCYFNGKTKPSMPKMVSNLMKIPERNKHILDIINTLRKIPERKILILSKMRDHLTFMKTEIDEAIKKDVENKLMEPDECKTYYYVGGMKDKERSDAEQNCDILFATYDMAHEGMDIDKLNTVILASPKKNVIQSVGRIMRKILETGDLRPIIIDLADNLSIFIRHREKRIEQYESNKYIVKNFYLEKDKLVSYDEYIKKKYGMTDEDFEKYKEKNTKKEKKEGDGGEEEEGEENDYINNCYEADLLKILDVDNVDLEKDDKKIENAEKEEKAEKEERGKIKKKKKVIEKIDYGEYLF